jgi:hypothetical protein
MEKNDIDQEAIVKRFTETLSGSARIWYDELSTVGLTWDKLQQEFTIEFTKQGKSIMDLKTEWVNFKFDPDRMDIRSFIREVKTTATLLEYDDDHIVSTLKSAMPRQVYYSIVREKKLDELEELLKDIFKNVQRGNLPAPGAVGGNPFAGMMSKPQKMAPPVYTQIQPYYVAPQPETAYWEVSEITSGNQHRNAPPPMPPYKPVIQEKKTRAPRQDPQQGRGPPMQNRDRRNWRNQRPPQRNFRDRGGRFQRNQGKYDPKRTRHFQNPNPNRGKKPRYTDNDKQKEIDWNRCHYCKENGHWAKDCPQKRKQAGFPGKTGNKAQWKSKKAQFNQFREIAEQYYQFMQEKDQSFYHDQPDEQEIEQRPMQMQATAYIPHEEN